MRSFLLCILQMLSLFPILHWSNVVFLLKHILKIGLAGKAKIVCNLGEAFAAVGEQAFCFFQFTSGNICAHINAKFIFKAFHRVGTAAMNLVCHILNIYWLIYMPADIIHAGIDFGSDTFRKPNISCPAAEILYHGILQ